MNIIDKLLIESSNFAKLADVNEFNLKERMIMESNSDIGVPYSFASVAKSVFPFIHEKEPELEDAGAASGPVYQLQSIVNSSEAPSANSFLSASQGVFNKVKELYPAGSKQYNVASYLPMMAEKLINKYLTNKPKEQEPQAQPTKLNIPVSSSLFLIKIYRQLRANQQLNEEDHQTFTTNKMLYTRRFSQLNTIQKRTPQQQQELNIIKFVLDRI